MILQNIQSCYSGKNFKISLVYVGLAIFLFYNLQTLILESSENLVKKTPQTYQQSRPEENISVRALTGEDGGSPAKSDSERNQTDDQQRVWISMGLCWGENTKVNGKESFPYSEAAVRSVQLWHRLTRARVLLTIVYTGRAAMEPPLRDYKDHLQELGASVSLVEASELSCVLTSQLIRLLPQEHHPHIRPRDIVVTADVDAFIMTPDILLPLRNASSVSVWVWRYELSYVSGYTFMMPFIGARSETWQEMIWYNGSLADTVHHYKNLLNISQEAEFWDTDQDIVSYSIIAHRKCSLQKSNKVWAKLNLPPRPFQDSKTCWHGSGIYEDCNNVLWQRNAMIKYYGGGCKWWHFYPYEGVKELEAKFQEIVSGQANNNFLDKLISGAAVIKSNVLDKFLTFEKKFREDPAGELEIWSDHMN